MPKLSALTSKKLVQIFKKLGFRLDHTTGSHFVFYHPETQKRAVIPYHIKDLPKGTINEYFKRSGY